MGASTILVPSIGNAYTDTDLVSYWACDEESGVRVDSHTTGNDLTDNNTVSFATGLIDNACDFEADNSEYLSITYANFTDSPLASGDFSFSYWIYRESAPSLGCVVSNAYWTGQRTGFYNCIDSNNYFKVEGHNSDAFEYFFDNQQYATGEWIHVVQVYNATEGSVQVYKNGTLDEDYQSVGTGNLVESTQSFYLGATDWTGTIVWFYDGLIDEVSLWSIAFTTDDVTDLYNSGSGLAYDQLFSTTSTSTATTSTSSVSVDELKWTIELYLALFSLLIFTYVGYRFTKVFI